MANHVFGEFDKTKKPLYQHYFRGYIRLFGTMKFMKSCDRRSDSLSNFSLNGKISANGTDIKSLTTIKTRQQRVTPFLVGFTSLNKCKFKNKTKNVRENAVVWWQTCLNKMIF
jgi:hypothetical protein